MLFMHCRLVRDDFSLLVISVPAATCCTAKVGEVSRCRRDEGLAEETVDSAESSEEG